jgi:hypothetical protein
VKQVSALSSFRKFKHIGIRWSDVPNDVLRVIGRSLVRTQFKPFGSKCNGTADNCPNLEYLDLRGHSDDLIAESLNDGLRRD